MTKRIQEDVHELTGEEVLAFGGRIVSTKMILVVWQQKSGRWHDRTMPLKLKKKGLLAPMGQHGGTLYWWRDEVEKATPDVTQTRGRPRKVQSEP